LEEILARSVQIFLALAGAYLVALSFALVVWTYRDIGSRSQSVVTQVLATLMVLLFSIPGALLYLLLRPRETLDQAFQRSLEEEYLLQDLEELPLCHSCHRYVDDDFVLCPHCQVTLREGCRSCGRLLHVKWSRCPYCGEDQTERAASIREQVEPPARRWISRGGRTFRPISPGTIREVPAPADATVLTIFEPEQPSLASVSAAGFDPSQNESAIGSGPMDEIPSPDRDEPVRLFDRKRTKAERQKHTENGKKPEDASTFSANAEGENSGERVEATTQTWPSANGRNGRALGEHQPDGMNGVSENGHHSSAGDTAAETDSADTSAASTSGR
jgi:RNA polymerase subunit RPABC4/transcription elongation factor Spt4